MTRLLALLALALCLPATLAQEPAPEEAGDGEVQLQTEALDILPWYSSVQGFARMRGLGCSVSLTGNTGISIKGGTEAEREQLIQVATLFEAEAAAGSGPQKNPVAPPAEQLGETLYARRTDFLTVDDARAAFPRVRALIAGPLPGLRKLSVFLVGERLVVFGETPLTVFLVGAAADAIKATLPVKETLGDWRSEAERLAARYESAGDAAYSKAFGGFMSLPDPVRQAHTIMRLGESCLRSQELYQQARELRLAAGLEPLTDSRAEVIAERIVRLPREAAQFFLLAAKDFEKGEDAAAAAQARERAKALIGE